MPNQTSTKKPARGRPALSDEKIAEMRRHISSCALHLYKSEGYAAVSMRNLAAEAGCTVMTLYRYFESKIDILRYIWDEIFTELFDKLTFIAEKTKEPESRLEAVCFAYVDYWMQNREHYFLVFMSGDVSQSEVSVFVDDHKSIERFALFYRCIEDAVTTEVDTDSLNLKAQSLLCALNGISHNLITISGFSWSKPKQLVEIAVAGLLKT